jgi:hypothetical protein
VTTSEAKRYSKSSDPAVRETALRVLAANKRSKALRASRRSRATGPTKAERKAAEDAREALGKAAAMERSKDFSGLPRCEVWDAKGLRCLETATDAHHALGGTHKKEMEALGGEGFIAECRLHHEGLSHGAARALALQFAEEHALRNGFKRLLKYVDKAKALHEGKHGRAS